MKINRLNNISNSKLSHFEKNVNIKSEQNNKDINLNLMPNYRPISFGAKSNQEKLAYIGEENFPNEIILQQYKQAIQNGDNTLLCEIHKNFYKQLLDCETLEDAKKLYPEFKDVIDAKDLETNEYNGTLKKIANGEIEGVTIENISLEILKKHYGQSLGYARKESYWGLDPSTNQNLFAKLNIKNLNRNYFLTINRETPERRAICAQNTQKLWEDSSYREGRSEDAKRRWKRPEYREQVQQGIRDSWNDEEKRAEAAETMRRLHADEAFTQKRIASIKKGWADPERREELTAINRQNLESRWANPESRVKMSEFMKAKWQDPVYREKICSGISERMLARWQDPKYIEFKTEEKLRQWADPEFRKYMSETMKEHWQDPAYREKMAKYSEALKLAWEMHPEISERMSQIAEEFPSLGKILTKSQKGEQLSEVEEKVMMAYYKKCHEEMPNFTWIVGQTQKEILALWEEEGQN